MKFKPTLAVVFLFPLLGILLHAQEEKFDVAAEIKQLNDQEILPDIPETTQRKSGERAFAVFSNTGLDEELYYFRGDEPVKVLFNVGTIRNFQFTELNEINLARLEVGEDGEDIYRTVAKATPAQGSSDGVIFFNPSVLSDDASNIPGLPYIDLSPNDFKVSSVRLANFTPAPLIYQFGNDKGNLKPFQVVEQNLGKKDEFYPVRIGIFNEDKAQLLYRNTFQREPNTRVLIILTPNPNKNQHSLPLRCLFYRDMGSI